MKNRTVQVELTEWLDHKTPVNAENLGKSNAALLVHNKELNLVGQAVLEVDRKADSTNTEVIKVKENITTVSSQLETVKTNNPVDLSLNGTTLKLKKSDGTTIGTGIDLSTGSGSENNVHKLNGVKWAVVGDSITDSKSCENTVKYHKNIANLTGCIPTDYGVSSTSIAIRNGRTDSMLERIDTIGTDFDIITILGGVNDCIAASPVPIGTLGSTDTKTFYGAYEALIIKLLNKYSNKAVGLMTPIAIAYTPNSQLDVYRQAILKLGEKYCIPVLDLWKESGLCCSVDYINNNYFYRADKLHPNAEGQKIIAKPILAFLEKIYSDFNVTAPPPSENKPVQSITLDKPNHTFKVDETVQLNVNFTPTDATNKNVTWSCNNNNATVSTTGLVTAKVEGSAIITATTQDGNKTATCNLTIQAKDSIIPPVGEDVTNGLKISYDLTTGYSNELIDLSGNNINATVTKKNGNNSDSYSIQHNSFMKYPITLEYFGAYTDSLSDVNKSYQIFNNRSSNGSGNGLFVFVTNANVNTANGIVITGSLSEPQVDIPNLNILGQGDKHIVIFLNSNSQKVYIDGSLVFTTNNSSTTLGNREIVFNGDVKANLKLFRWYNRELTQEEVTKRYEKCKTL